jgi:hypothetical protein
MIDSIKFVFNIKGLLLMLEMLSWMHPRSQDLGDGVLGFWGFFVLIG